MSSNYLPTTGINFRKLSNEKLERIHAASLEILERTGLRLLEPNAVQLLKSKGATGGRWGPRTHPCQTGGMGASYCTQKYKTI